jgi:hypothetical protein
MRRVWSVADVRKNLRKNGESYKKSKIGLVLFIGGQGQKKGDKKASVQNGTNFRLEYVVATSVAIRFKRLVAAAVFSQNFL